MAEHISNAKSETVGEGHVSDKLHEYLGGSPGAGKPVHLNDQWRAFLTAAGFNTGNWNTDLFNYLGSLGHTGSLSDRLYQYWGGGGSGPGPGPGPSGPAFAAAGSEQLFTGAGSFEFLGQYSGVGTPTYTMDDGTLLLTDEGLYAEGDLNTMPAHGARRVENMAPHSTDYTTAAGWNLGNGNGVQGIGDPFGGTEATRFSVGAGLQETFRQRYSADSFPDGTIVAASAWVRVQSGNLTGQFVRFYIGGAQAALPLSGEWKRLTTIGLKNNGLYDFGFNIFANNGALEVDVYGIQFERVTGKANQNPSEYVPTTGTPATRYFSNANGNSVASNIVTEADGAALAEQPALISAPALTNLLRYSNNQEVPNGAGGWNSTNGCVETQDQIGITGAPNTATLITDANASAESRCYQSNLTGQTVVTCTFRLWIKKDADTSRFPTLGVNDSGGRNSYWSLNTQTGAIAPNSDIGNHVSAVSEVVDAGDWWEVYHQLETATTNVFFWIIPAYASAFGGGLDGTAQGSIIVGNTEWYVDKTIGEVKGSPPVITEAASVTRGNIETQYATGNHNSTKAAYYAEVEFLGEYFASDFVFATGGGTGDRLIFVNTSGPQILTRTNGPTVGKIFTWGSGFLKYGVSYDAAGAGDIGNTLNGDAYTESTGFLNVGTESSTLTHVDGLAPHLMRNIRRYDITDYADGKSILDGLMS